MASSLPRHPVIIASAAEQGPSLAAWPGRCDASAMIKQRHAEIAGGGFAGLTAACALAQRGWSVRVHERADRLRTTGSGIYIYENGLRVLEAVGAYDAAVEGAPRAHTREVRDDRNRVIAVHRWDASR